MERFAGTVEALNMVSPCYPPLPTKPNLGDFSFSSYLHPSSDPKSPQECELSIFNAERYFNDNPDQKPPKILEKIVERSDFSTITRPSSVSSVDGYGRNYRTGSFHATPTASSEASWNSQSGLLSNPPGSLPVSLKHLNSHKKTTSSTLTTTTTTSSSSSSSSSRKWLFGRKCPCSGNKAVDVEEKFQQPRCTNSHTVTSNAGLSLKKETRRGEEVVVVEKKVAKLERKQETQNGFLDQEISKMKLIAQTWGNNPPLVRDSGVFSPEGNFTGRRVVPSGRNFTDVGGFSFPILNPPPAGKLVIEDPPRESLDVFQPPVAADDPSPVKKSSDFQRRGVLQFPGDATRRSFTFPASPKGRSPDDDVASDSSSDLFEIESFSTNATPTYRRRESLDEIARYAGMLPGSLQFRRSLDETTTTTGTTEIYEPSEVSVDWSVTTADGFDRGSVANFSASASEFGEAAGFIGAGPVAIAGGKRRGVGLLSCQSEKAVSVGPIPARCGPDQRRVGPPRHAIESAAQMSAAARLANGSYAHVPKAFDKPPLARSNSARMSRTR